MCDVHALAHTTRKITHDITPNYYIQITATHIHPSELLRRCCYLPPILITILELCTGASNSRNTTYAGRSESHTRGYIHGQRSSWYTIVLYFSSLSLSLSLPIYIYYIYPLTAPSPSFSLLFVLYPVTFTRQVLCLDCAATGFKIGAAKEVYTIH